MNTKLQIMLAITAGVVVGAAGVQGLHAQAKPKAYVITETEVIDAAAQKVYTPLVEAAQKAAGARRFETAGGKIVAFAGDGSQACDHHRVGQPGSRCWHTATRKAWKDLAPQRDKAIKIIRSYAVEAMR